MLYHEPIGILKMMEKIQKKLPQRCPSCDGILSVQELHCDNCETEVVGKFDLPILARLSPEDQRFVLQFVCCSGSLKDMSKQLKLSYPTVRNLLDDLIVQINLIQKEQKQ